MAVLRVPGRLCQNELDLHSAQEDFMNETQLRLVEFVNRRHLLCILT